MKKRVRILVSGMVQGVFFRDFTRRQAIALGLIGWVRNLPDGRVEALAEGEPAAVMNLIAHLRKGPPSSRVTKVQVDWSTPAGDLKGFEIRF